MMPAIRQELLEDFVSGKYQWGGLTPGDQQFLAREVLRLREVIDTWLNEGYEEIRSKKAKYDGYNVLAHRKG